MTQSRYELQTVVERFLPRLSAMQGISRHQLKVLSAIQNCRTSVLGGHKEVCKDCGQIKYAYNSCRNRHCPKCQGIDLERWVMAREEDLLPVKYFHVIFTLPEQLNDLCIHHLVTMYNLLFETVWDVLRSFAGDENWLGARLGAFAILHTWSQTLTLHPHIHLIIPAGGISENGTWKASKSKGKFLFEVTQLSPVFRARFVAGVRKWAKSRQLTLDHQIMDSLFKKQWVVYALQPFGGPRQVIKYLGQYTRRIAISNYRIKEITGEGFDPSRCSDCGGEMVVFKIIPRQRAPPLPLWNLKQHSHQ